MIPVSYLFNDPLNFSKNEDYNVDEMSVPSFRDVAHTGAQLLKRPFRRKEVMPTTLPSRNPALLRAAAVMNNKLR